MSIQDVLDALNAERYGPSLWWAQKLADEVTDDSEASTARRRRALAEDYDRLNADERAKGSAA